MTKATRGLRALGPFLRLHPWAVAGIVGLGLLASLAEGIGISLFIPLLQGLDETRAAASAEQNWLVEALGRLFRGVPAGQRLYVIAACIFGSVLLRTALGYGHRVVFSWLDARISHQLRAGIFDQLLSVGYGFLERRKASELVNTLASETWRTSEALSVLVSGVITVCTIAVYTALLLLISWEMTLLVAVAMLMISGVAWLVTRSVRELGRQATRANETLTHWMLEGVNGMQAIRAYGREAYEQARFEEASRRVSHIFMRLGIQSGLVNPVYEVLSAVLLVAILIVGLRAGMGNLPALLVFVFVLYRLQPKAQALDNARTGLRSLAGAVEAVTALLDRTDKPYTRSGTAPHERLREAITFERLTFRYGAGERPALEDASLRIPAGKTTALVGPSGAGKSTLIKLIFRFYDAEGGTIYVDGRPLADLDLASWREKIALVSQEAYIFNTAVWDNIAYGRLGAPDEEVLAAARQANAHGFIEKLPQGYDTNVGDRGVRLSGGQKQRVALARAIVRDPEILILDEATNALDSITENLIQEALALLRRDRTVILIAHRLSTVEEADHVVVLDEGRVREEGHPQELLEQSGGLFARLHAAQYSRSAF